MEEMKRTQRGFLEIREFSMKWHGKANVRESSLAFEGPCVWLFCEKAYANDPTDHPPHPHLAFDDAKALRDALTDFIQCAEKGLTTEQVNQDKKS